VLYKDGVDYPDTRAAIWRLIERDMLILTPNRELIIGESLR
jgi:hypothetical protein